MWKSIHLKQCHLNKPLKYSKLQESFSIILKQMIKFGTYSQQHLNTKIQWHTEDSSSTTSLSWIMHQHSKCIGNVQSKWCDYNIWLHSNTSYHIVPGFKLKARGFCYIGIKDKSIVNGSVFYITTNKNWNAFYSRSTDNCSISHC